MSRHWNRGGSHLQGRDSESVCPPCPLPPRYTCAHACVCVYMCMWDLEVSSSTDLSPTKIVSLPVLSPTIHIYAPNSFVNAHPQTNRTRSVDRTRCWECLSSSILSVSVLRALCLLDHSCTCVCIYVCVCMCVYVTRCMGYLTCTRTLFDMYTHTGLHAVYLLDIWGGDG